MDPGEARALLATARVARLATVAPDGSPHLVPICFALVDDRIVTAIDHKPKRPGRLARLRNIEAEPHVSVLADYYEDADWTRLWWARADGTARILPASPAAVAPLVARYPQYAARPPEGPVIEIAVLRWSGWRG
jgi:PPOX class probable F420-dependent enzyme